MTVAPTVGIRRACAADADRLTAVAHAAKRHWGYAEELITLWRDALTVTAGFIAEHPTYVAQDGAAVVGFYALSSEGGVFEVEHFWVDAGHMRRGVGALLFRHAVGVVRAQHGSVVHIASDPNAEGFYLRMGARRIGEVNATPAGRTLPLLVLEVTG